MRTPQRIPVRELIGESAAAAAMEATIRELTFQVDEGAPGLEVCVDRYLFEAALANLLQNAFKFTAARSRVSLSVETVGQRVLIEVADECGGLPPGKPEELFRPFEQRGKNRTGLGLGLSIARKSVEANGGDLRVRDMPGKGCAFSIDLQRADGG
jgi:signal transduction histidine kinase